MNIYLIDDTDKPIKYGVFVEELDNQDALLSIKEGENIYTKVEKYTEEIYGHTEFQLTFN